MADQGPDMTKALWKVIIKGTENKHLKSVIHKILKSREKLRKTLLIHSLSSDDKLIFDDNDFTGNLCHTFSWYRNFRWRQSCRHSY